MKQIINNLFIGNQKDFELNDWNPSEWYIIHACKEPYHREALGYSGRAVSKDHPNYSFIKRDNELILNLVDAKDVKYIPSIIIDEAIKLIEMNINSKKVFLHCNQGQSRSATIGLLFLVKNGYISHNIFNEAEKEFLKLYSDYLPSKGMRDYAKNNWLKYLNND